MKANDPEYQKMLSSREETTTNGQISTLNNDLKELGIDTVINSLDDIVNLENYDNVLSYIKKGNNLSEAYFLANKQSIIKNNENKVQQDTTKQIEANGDSAVGSLTDTGESEATYTEEQVDAMSQSEVNAKYDIIRKSMKSW